MRLRYIAFTAFIVVLALALVCCDGGGDTATMRELAGIDSLLSKARQYELAQHRLDSLHPDGFNQAERAYYSLLLSQSHYKNYINDTTDAVINKAVDYYEHRGVLDEAQRIAGGTLNESEMNFLALYCYGFSRTVIMICMKYSSLGTVSNKKIQIAKKLGVNNLDDFVNNYR